MHAEGSSTQACRGVARDHGPPVYSERDAELLSAVQLDQRGHVLAHLHARVPGGYPECLGFTCTLVARFSGDLLREVNGLME